MEHANLLAELSTSAITSHPVMINLKIFWPLSLWHPSPTFLPFFWRELCDTHEATKRCPWREDLESFNPIGTNITFVVFPLNFFWSTSLCVANLVTLLALQIISEHLNFFSDIVSFRHVTIQFIMPSPIKIGREGGFVNFRTIPRKPYLDKKYSN